MNDMSDTKGIILGEEDFQKAAPGVAPSTGKGGAPAYFSVWDVHAYYGESYIVQGISFDVREGEIVALLGRNGAGKTSTLRTIARVDDPALTHGEIWLDHQPLHEMKAHQASRAGIGLVPEDRRIIQGLTVEENLKLAQIAPPHGWSIERIYELFPRLGERRKQEGTTLSGGEQQMLAIGRALMTNPRLLILDEATEGLAPIVRQEIWSAISRLKSETGMSILLIDKSLKELQTLADEAVVVQRGATVWNGRMSELTPEVTQQYVGV